MTEKEQPNGSVHFVHPGREQTCLNRSFGLWAAPELMNTFGKKGLAVTKTVSDRGASWRVKMDVQSDSRSVSIRADRAAG